MGDGRNIPSEVMLVKEGLKFLIPILVERKSTFERISNDLPTIGDGESRGTNNSFVQQSIELYDVIDSVGCLTAVDWRMQGYVGPTISNFKTHVGSCKEKGFALVDMSHPLGHFDSN